MSRIEYLKEKLNRKINLYGVGSTKALKVSQQLDKEIEKVQGMIWRDYKCKQYKH